MIMRVIVALFVSVNLTISFTQTIDFYPVTDPFDYRNKNRVVIRGSNTNNLNTDPHIVWQCDGIWTSQLYVKVDNHKFLSSEPIPVRYSFDDSPSSQYENWFPSVKGTAAFASYGRALSFTAKALTQSRVIFGLIDHEGNEHTIEFLLTNLGDYIDQLGCRTIHTSTATEIFRGPPKQVYNRLTETLTKLGITYTEGDNPSVSTTDLSALGLRNLDGVVTISARNITIIIETLGNNLNNSNVMRSRLRLGTHSVKTRAVLTTTAEFKALISEHFEQDYTPMFRFGINAGPEETKSVVRELLGDTIINDDSNLILVENLEIHFFAKAFDAGTYLAFDGTNTKLYEEIRNELEKWSRLGAPQ